MFALVNPELKAGQCPVCGEENRTESPVCAACEAAFGSSSAGRVDTDGIDLGRYATKMFPWEPSEAVPKLGSGRWWALALCLALVLIVVLLELLRTPIPACWEVG
ncbi:MAG: hypothetical protein JOZ08_25590 [Verrucomicrobia bacterium]|nr:hypothetical protein [Verrucomicrobiota bacterium]